MSHLEKKENFDGKLKNITNFPTEKGEYCISIKDVDFIDAVYFEFDGTRWHGLENYIEIAKYDLANISYYNDKPLPKVTPFTLKDPLKMPWKI